ncbi:MAG: glycosyltransferase [Chloroflexota bacterium]
MKIVYFIDHLRPEGTQKFLRQLVSGLATRGHQQTVLCLNNSWDEPVVRNLRDAGAEVRIIGKLALGSGFGLVYYCLWLRNQQFDVAVTFLFVADVLGRTLAKMARIPRIISSLRARNINYAGWQRWLLRRTMPWANLVVINSKHVRDFAIQEEGASPDKIQVISNSVDIKKYAISIEVESLRHELGIPANSLVVGGVGRLTYQKGFDILIQAFALLSEIDCYLLIIGEGEEKENLRLLSQDLKVEDRVILTDFRTDIPEMLHIIDFYVQPSRWEGMPNSLLEAMAAGRPIIASDIDGVRELIDNEAHGWLIPPEDPLTLRNTIQKIMANHDDAQRCAYAAKSRVAREFDGDTMVVAWEKVLAQPMVTSKDEE